MPPCLPCPPAFHIHEKFFAFGTAHMNSLTSDRPKSEQKLRGQDRDFALSAFRSMSFIRAFEKKAWDMSIAQPPIVVGSVHLCAGQEAIPVGACAALGPEDRVIATYRGHGWALALGLDPQAVMDEICHRETGLNGGRAGSPYMMAPDQRFIGENSIVGAGVPIANGVAMASQMAKNNGVVVVSFGEGAMNQGALHEGFVFAAARNLPVVFVCENNSWSELTPTSRIVKIDRMAKRAAGYGFPGATIDGCDPVAVRDTLAIAIQRARSGEGPSLIECSTVRLWGHYNRDVEHYRPKEDRSLAEQREPIARLSRRLVDAGLASENELLTIADETVANVEQIGKNSAAAPHPDPSSAALHVIAPSVADASRKWPNAPEGTEITYQQAVNEALRAELTARPEVVVFGEDVGHAGGIFGCSRNLQREFGEERVFDTPIAEASILGAAVGASMSGLKPVAEIMWMDFLMVAMDQLVNQAANIRYVSQGTATAPMVMRVQQGATPGSCSQHSQSLEALLAHIPGLKVGLPSTPQDAYDMLRAAIDDPDPCIIIEARSLYQTKGAVDGSRTAVGSARTRRAGSDIALISWGTMANTAELAAASLQKDGIDAAVLDLRWLAPLDDKTLLETVRRAGGKALVVHEANQTGGFGAEIVSRLLESGFTRVRRLGAPDIRVPAAPALQAALLPSADQIATIAKAIVAS